MSNLDLTDKRILSELENNARISWADLGRSVALTAPAVRERVRRLERSGIITGYKAQLSYEKLGYPIEALIRVAVTTHERTQRVTNLIKGMPEVAECLLLTGEDTFSIHVRVATMKDLERITASLQLYGRTTTSVVLEPVSISHTSIIH